MKNILLLLSALIIISASSCKKDNTQPVKHPPIKDRVQSDTVTNLIYVNK